MCKNFLKRLMFLISTHKIIVLSLCCFSEILFLGGKLHADSFDKRLQYYFKDTKDLETKKQKARRVVAQKHGRVIKYKLIKKSAVQSKKGKAKTAADKMVDAGLITASMVKKNRWFVQKPYETSFIKISSIKRYQPPPLNQVEIGKISRKAFKISKKRSRETGPVKPDILYSEETSIGVLQMTRARARDTGTVKPDILYSESAGRDAQIISRTRARDTGTVKPDILYSASVSREAKSIVNKRSEKFPVATKDLVFSAEMIKNMGRIPPRKNIPFKSEPSSVEKIAE